MTRMEPVTSHAALHLIKFRARLGGGIMFGNMLTNPLKENRKTLPVHHDGVIGPNDDSKLWAVAIEVKRVDVRPGPLLFAHEREKRGWDARSCRCDLGSGS